MHYFLDITKRLLATLLNRKEPKLLPIYIQKEKKAPQKNILS